jgi:predicted dinucleotide-binding enzyme
MGGTLGTLLTRAGHEVIFSYARSRKKLDQLAQDAGGGARSATPAEAVAQADAVLLAVHWSRVDDVLAQTGSLAGRTLITCSLPMDADDSRLVLGFTTSGAEALAVRLPQAQVVSAFGTAPSEVLLPVFNRRGPSTSPDMIYCGDHQRAKDTVAQLIRDVGFNPVDLGALQAARYVEPFALLVAALAYDGTEGPEVAYRFERLRT